MDIDMITHIPSQTLSSYNPLPHMPENIWLDVFGYLTLKEKFIAAGTCRDWHRIMADPTLYTHISLEHLEFNALVLCMKQLCRLSPRIRSLRIRHCYSTFISTTTVPVHHSAIAHHFPQHPQMHTLHSHITSFALPRRREEYRKLGFTLHQDFSRALACLMEQSQDLIKCLEIQDNFLDLEMSDLVYCLVKYGRHLEHLLYDANRDNGFVAPEVVSAITAACPNIQAFQGQHAISDDVLVRMMTGWKDLRSVTLAPFQVPGVVGSKQVSLEGFWALLECGKVESLNLLDLDCISNDSIRTMVQRVKQLESTGYSHASSQHPFAHHASFSMNQAMARPLPGASVRHLNLTKFTSAPLTLPGFGDLLTLFPNLESFRLTTNFFAYDYQFQGLTKDIYHEEMVMVERMVHNEMTHRFGPARAPLCWQSEWAADMIEDQRLRAGVMRSA